jgi:hypothetical protein
MYNVCIYVYAQDLIEAGKLMEEVGRPLLMDNQVVISCLRVNVNICDIYIYIYNGTSDIY